MDFIKWDRLAVTGIKYRSDPAALSIGSIRAQAPYARVIIDQNRNLNITEALKPAGTATVAPPPAPRRTDNYSHRCTRTPGTFHQPCPWPLARS